MLTLKKSLGQHFLIDETVSQRIVKSLQGTPFRNLLEVGPGGGALTKYLVKIPGINLKCIEIDAEKASHLLKNYPFLKDKVIVADILTSAEPFSEPFSVVGNFPYNISSQIVFKILDWKESVESMTGMFQREVAQRLAAKEGSKIYGVTSVLVQAFFKVDYLFEVSELAFNPPPKVKSAVIRLTPVDQPVKMRDHRSFTVLVKAGFGQRRKTLRNAVKALFDAETLKDELFNKRAEALSVEDFAALTFRMS